VPRAPGHLCGGCCRVIVPYGTPRCPPCTAKQQAQRLGHRREREPGDVARRGTAAERGYGARWRNETRPRYAASHPWCEDCLARDIRTPVQIVHHRIEPRGDDALMHDPANLKSACRSCHLREHGRRGLPGYVAGSR